MSERSVKKRLSNEELITLVQQEAVKLGRPPKVKEFHYAAKDIGMFRYWRTFLRSAGLEFNLNRKQIENDELIQLVQERAKELGRTPRAKESHYGQIAIGRYGSWRKFLHSAGLKMNNKKINISDEELIQLVQAKAA